jgi:hypothetical protein
MNRPSQIIETKEAEWKACSKSGVRMPLHGHVRYWHLADIRLAPANVRFRGVSPANSAVHGGSQNDCGGSCNHTAQRQTAAAL